MTDDDLITKTSTSLAEIDAIEESFIANIDAGERALAAAETDYERMAIRDAARAGQMVTMAMGRRKLVRRFSVLVQRAERAIAQANPPSALTDRAKNANAVRWHNAEPLNAPLTQEGVGPNLLTNVRKAHLGITDEEFETIVATEDDEDAPPVTRQQFIDYALEKRQAEERQKRQAEEQARRVAREQEEIERRQQWVEKSQPVADTIQIGERSRVIFKDNLDPERGLHTLLDEVVALTFTSPPYWNFVDYGYNDNGVGAEAAYEEYINSLQSVFTAIWQKTMPGGRAVVNVSNMKSRSSVEGETFVYPIVADVIRVMKHVGFTFFDEIIWHKGSANAGALGGNPLWGSYPYPPTPKILDSTFENILVFTKSGQRTPSSDTKEQSRLTLEEWRQYTKGVWDVPHDRDPNHPATFPMEIADRVVRMYSLVNDLVIDPFAGTGTTTIAAERYHRVGLGYEISPLYMDGVREKADRWLTKSPRTTS